VRAPSSSTSERFGAWGIETFAAGVDATCAPRRT